MTMEELKKMVTAMANSISVFRTEMNSRFEEVDKRFDGLETKIDKVEKNLTARIDKIGKTVAYLEDDAPTRDEHDELVGRVTNLEQKISS